jgi:dolichol-phosphate mannosyltransferase
MRKDNPMGRKPNTGQLLSVVVPCANEQEVLLETHRRLTSVLAQIPIAYEIVYVDDGSADSTPDLLREIQRSDERVRVVRLARNFGHQIAITAGLENSAGNAVVIIDADLQDPPEVIAQFVAHWRSGYEVVYGLRTQREGETTFKIWTARLFYRFLAGLSETEIPLDAGDFRLMDRKVVDALLAMPERDRFLRGMVSWVGFSQVAVPYRRAPRAAGQTKYSISRMVLFAADAIVSFSTTPLKLATWFGLFVSATALVGILLTVLARLFGHSWVQGWASILVAILFLGGVQLVCMGIIGEYIGRIYAESKHRPLYIVRERLGFHAGNLEAQRQEDAVNTKVESSRG